MADTVKESLAQLGQQVQGWSLQKRFAVLFAAGLAIALISTAMLWSSKQNNVPLLSNLTEEDAAQIVAKLESDHVPYELAAGGTAIMVPESQVHALRLKLAGEGLPKGGNVGFELFDSPSFGMSRFAEQLNYRRGLEGELRRSIRQIDAVQDARVHIVVPEEGLFREQDKKASAAITLHLRPGRVLGGGQVQAIVHLVASSVSGLSPEQVTVVDSTGTILAKGGEGAGGLSRGLEQQRAVEKGVEERVHAILAPIVGAQHVVVRASAVVDFSRTDKTTESYDPASQVVRSAQTSEEKRGGTSAGSGGVAGARSNLSGVQNQQAPLSGNNSERRSSTTNYEVNKVVAHEVGAQGRLARLSVAVLVDGVEVTDAAGAKTSKERSPEELARFEELARRAMGFDADREDQVSVQSMAFGAVAVALAPEEAEPAAYGRMFERFWPPVLALFAALMLGLIVVRLKPGASTSPSMGDGLLPGSPRTVAELERALSAAAASGGSPGGMVNLGNAPPDVMAKLTTRLEPKLAASVLKGWLNET